jgi:hypothetical protein
MPEYYWGTKFPHSATLTKGEAVGVVPLRAEDTILVWDDDRAANKPFLVEVDLYAGEVNLPVGVDPCSVPRIIRVHGDGKQIHAKLRVDLGYYLGAVAAQDKVRVYWNEDNPAEVGDWKTRNRIKDKDDSTDGRLVSCGMPNLKDKLVLEVVVLVAETP